MDPLIRVQLPPGWVDLAVGEAHVVRQALQAIYPSSLFNIEDVATDCDYQAPEGYSPLVKALEERHDGHVVVTSGAKQGLLAVFYALRKLGQTHISMRTPYWSQMPEAIKLGGLGLVLGDTPTWGCSYLIVSPNNPDGRVTTPEEAQELKRRCDKMGTFVVHDGAYHTLSYLNQTPKLAGTTIYSASKMYGLSGFRVGWVVTDDEKIAKLVSGYVEAASVGVSLLSQRVMHNIIRHEELNPETLDRFHERAMEFLDSNKRRIKMVNPDVLDTSNVPEHGIFGWFKPGRLFDADRAMVRIPPGRAFGDPSHVRVNLAINHELLQLVVERMNKLV